MEMEKPLKKNRAFVSPLVLCPFYQFESKNCICCSDNIPRNGHIKISFDPGEKSKHKEKFCKKECEKCRVYKAILGRNG